MLPKIKLEPKIWLYKVGESNHPTCCFVQLRHNILISKQQNLVSEQLGTRHNHETISLNILLFMVVEEKKMGKDSVE